MLPLRKHSVRSKHLTDVVKHHKALEEESRGWVSVLPTDQCKAGQKWDLKAGQQVLKSHYMSS